MSEIRLRAWMMPAAGMETADVLERAFQPFYRAHPGVHITWRIVPWSRAWTEINTAYKRNEMPDLFQVGSTWVGTLARLGQLLPVPAGIEKRPVLADWIREAATYKGTKMAVPWVADATLMVVRTDIMERYGIDENQLKEWDSFLTACETIGADAAPFGTDPMRPVPIGFPGRPELNTVHHITPWLFSAGWNFDALESLPVRMIAHPSIQGGFGFIRQLLTHNSASASIADFTPFHIRRGFYQEGSFALFASYWTFEVCRALTGSFPGVEIRYPVSPIPLPAGKAGSIGLGGMSTLGVSPKSKNAEAAWSVVQYMLSDEFHRVWSAATGETTAHLGAFWEDPTDRSQSQMNFLNMLRESILSARTMPVHPVWLPVEHVLTQGLSRILLMLIDKEPDHPEVLMAAQEVDARVNAILRFSWEPSHVG